jgi:hypothetical protein
MYVVSCLWSVVELENCFRHFKFLLPKGYETEVILLNNGPETTIHRHLMRVNSLEEGVIYIPER